MWKKTNSKWDLAGKLEETCHSKDVFIVERIILKWNLRK
jgi:hypothetical protein